MLKKLKIFLCCMLVISGVCANADEYEFADESEELSQPEVIQTQEIATVNEVADDDFADRVSVAALDEYDMSGSLFEKITLLEQDKVVLQLEKERAQLDLELERLNAEKLKLQMELDTLSGRAEHQQQELEAQAESLKRQKESLEDSIEKQSVEKKSGQQKQESGNLASRYKLINIAGIGNQLQATVENISSGQTKRISVGKELDGYRVKSISLNEGIIFEKDGVSENLNIGK